MPFCNQYTIPTRETPSFLTGHPTRVLPLDSFFGLTEDKMDKSFLDFSDIHIVRNRLNALPSNKGLWLLRLADLLLRRFWRLNQKDDLEEAIWCYQKAVSLLSQTHHHFLEAILGLCSSLYQRFRLLGHLDDLTKLLDHLHIEHNLDLKSLLTPVKRRLQLVKISSDSKKKASRNFNERIREVGLVQDSFDALKNSGGLKNLGGLKNSGGFNRSRSARESDAKAKDTRTTKTLGPLDLQVPPKQAEEVIRDEV